MATPDESLTQYLVSRGMTEEAIAKLHEDEATWASLRRRWDAETVTIQVEFPEGFAGEITDEEFRQLVADAAGAVGTKATVAEGLRLFGAALEKGVELYLSKGFVG